MKKVIIGSIYTISGLALFLVIIFIGNQVAMTQEFLNRKFSSKLWYCIFSSYNGVSLWIPLIISIVYFFYGSYILYKELYSDNSN